MLTFSNMQDHIGKELGVTQWFSLEQNRIQAFADATLDHQWIHLDEARTKTESPYGTTIAHGYLILSLLPKFSYELNLLGEDIAAGLNYGSDKVRFIAPVKSGARIRDRVTLLSTEQKDAKRVLLKMSHSIEIEGEDKPAMIAETLAMLLKA